MFNLVFLLSQYQLLELTAKHLSTIDLYHTALACSDLHEIILKSENIFKKLCRVALCDGSGLRARQSFSGIYNGCPYRFGRPSYEEEIEVRVFNARCDEKGGLPCIKCGINVCEECRYVPRVRDDPSYMSSRRPHLRPDYSSVNIICYCNSCDKGVEQRMQGKLCGCDQYTRWICLRCRYKEIEESGWYYKNFTKYGDDMEGDGMVLGDHQHNRAFFCPCGARPLRMGNIRCLWCRRQHRTRTYTNWNGDLAKTLDFGTENVDHIPEFDDNPDLPQTPLTWGPPILLQG